MTARSKKPRETAEARRRRLGLCAVSACPSPRGKKKKYCHKHHHRKHKERDKISYLFSRLKQHARERGKLFTITLDQFRLMCEFSGYHKKSGRFKTNLSIDRVNNWFGYHIWNMAIITTGQNAAKRNNPAPGFFIMDEEGVSHYVVSDVPKLEGDAPF